jgi:hypothetical protein
MVTHRDFLNGKEIQAEKQQKHLGMLIQMMQGSSYGLWPAQEGEVAIPTGSFSFPCIFR